MMPRDDEVRAMLERRATQPMPPDLLEEGGSIAHRTTQRRRRRRPSWWPARPQLVLATVAPVVAVVALVIIVTNWAPSRSPDPAASVPALPAPSASSVSLSPPAESGLGRFDVQVGFSPTGPYRISLWSYLRIEPSSGDTLVSPPGDDPRAPPPEPAQVLEMRTDDGVRSATALLAPGTYAISGFQRPCGRLSCPPSGVLHEATDTCTATIGIAAGDRIAASVTVHEGYRCTIALERTHGPDADRPVVLCESGPFEVGLVRPGCHGAVQRAVGLVGMPLPRIATAVAVLTECPAGLTCPSVPEGAAYPDRVAWRVRFLPADGTSPREVFVPAEQKTVGAFGGIEVVNHPWDGPYNDMIVGTTPQPTPDPSARALGVPLRIDQLEIPLDHTGHWTVDLGEVVLPNGYHSETSFRVPNGGDGTYRAGLIRVDLVPIDPDAPGWDAPYRRLIDGREPFRAVLTFDLESYLPGAVMEIADLVVE